MPQIFDFLPVYKRLVCEAQHFKKIVGYTSAFYQAERILGCSNQRPPSSLPRPCASSKDILYTQGPAKTTWTLGHLSAPELSTNRLCFVRIKSYANNAEHNTGHTITASGCCWWPAIVVTDFLLFLDVLQKRNVLSCTARTDDTAFITRGYLSILEDSINTTMSIANCRDNASYIKGSDKENIENNEKALCFLFGSPPSHDLFCRVELDKENIVDFESGIAQANMESILISGYFDALEAAYTVVFHEYVQDVCLTGL